MIIDAGITPYIQKLFSDFKDNRKLVEPEWERNRLAFKGIPTPLDPKKGVGRKESGTPEKDDWRSRSVSDLTRVKVNAGKMLVCDVLLQGGNIPMALKVNRSLQGISELILGEIAGEPGISEPEGQTAGDRQNPAYPMERLIAEQLVRAKADQALKLAVKSACIYGEGISRIYIDDFKTDSYRRGPEGTWDRVEIISKGCRMRNVSVWDFFTDMENKDIQTNRGIIERSMMSYQDIMERFSGDDEHNIPGALDKIRRTYMEDSAGVSKDSEAPWLSMLAKRGNTLEVLEFWGRIPAKYLGDTEKGNGEDVEINAVLVENTLVRLMPSDGCRPYFRIFWEEPVDDLRATGIADACSSAQQSYDSVMRLIEDNKKLTANAMFAVKSLYVENKHDDKRFYPGKEIEISEECDDVRRAIQMIQFPDIGQQGMDLLTIYKNAGNESAMIPEISHGQVPDHSATAYEVGVRNENASKYISDIIRGIDDNWIEPVVRFFYEWNMFDPVVPDVFKGTFHVEAKGFSSYKDRILRLQALNEMLKLALSSETLSSMIDVGGLVRELMRTNDMDPDKFLIHPGAQGEQGNTELLQFADQVRQKIEQLEQQQAQLMEALPALSRMSELEAQEKIAKIQKLNAETNRMTMDAETTRMKAQTERARAVAGIEKDMDAETRQEKMDMLAEHQNLQNIHNLQE